MTNPNCSERYPTTAEQWANVKDNTGIVAVICICIFVCVLVTLNFLEELRFLLMNHKRHAKRTRIILILGMFPVIAWTSLLNVFVPTSIMITELLACIYVSVCVLEFIHLMVDYFGGTNNMLIAFAGETISFCTPPVCCCCLCLRRVDFAKKTLKTLKLMVLQICIVRPVILFVVAVLYLNGSYQLEKSKSPSYPNIYLKVLNAVSTMTAIWGLIVCFKASVSKLKNIPRLPLKFGALKLAVLFVDLQLTVLTLLAGYEVIGCSGTSGGHVRAVQIHNFMMVFEMLLISIIARFAYRIPDEANDNTNEEIGIDEKELKKIENGTS